MNENSRREVDLMIQRNRLAREQRNGQATIPGASSLLVPKADAAAGATDSGSNARPRIARSVVTTRAPAVRASTPSALKGNRVPRYAIIAFVAMTACGVGFGGYKIIMFGFGPSGGSQQAYAIIRSSMLNAAPVVKKPWTAPTHVPTHGPIEPFPYSNTNMPTALPPSPAGVASSSSPVGPTPSAVRGMGTAPAAVSPGAVSPPRKLAESATAVLPYSQRNAVPVVARPGAQHLARVVLHRAGAARAAAQVAATEAAERVRLAAAAAATKLPAPVAVPGVKVGVTAPVTSGVRVVAVASVSPKIASSASANSFVVYHEAASPSPRTPARAAVTATAVPAASPFGRPVQVAAASPRPAQALSRRVVRVANAAAAPLQVIAFPASDLVLIGSKQNGAMTVSPYRVGDFLPDGSRIVRVDPAQGLVFTNEGTLRVVH